MCCFLRPSLLILAAIAGAAFAADETIRLNPALDTVCYVGTYTNGGKSKGIYAFRLETKNVEVSQNILLLPLGLAAESPNPSFLEVDLKRRLVFAANEVNTFEGKPSGAVSSFAIDAATGRLKFINQVGCGGTGPCHVVLDRTGKNLLVANYGSGSVAVIPVAADGRLGAATTMIQHTGKSVDPQRQKGPHAHCTTLDPANKFAFVCDLGLDKLVAYRFDAQNGKLTAEESLTVATKPGAGPRHMAFRPDGKFAYVINEMNSTVTAYAYDAGTGKLNELQTESSLPPSFEGKNSGAEIAVHPSGRWLYVSNRGNDAIVLFDIDARTGRISFTEEQNTGGKTPRHFSLQPGARHLAVANQNSDTLLVCRIDEGNGRLKPSGVTAACPAPVCIIFVPPAGR